jgi:hypothetical protein
MTQRFHGIALANNSFAENFHFERLAADPSPITHGRIWFNTTDGSFKYSSLASDGAVVVNAFASVADLVASVNSLTANLNSEIAARTDAINTFTTALNQEVANRTNAVAAEQQARIDGDAAEAAARTSAIAVLAGTTSNADATETAARLAGDAAQTIRSNGIQAELDTVEASLGLNTDGTYTAPANTIYLATVTTHKEADVALDAAIHNEVVRATGAETSLASGLANEAQLRTDGDANLQAQLIAYINSAVTNNVNADNAETAARIAADAALQSELDVTQASIGLNTDGTIAPITGTNYIDGIKSVFAGAFILDTQIHTNAVNIANETTARQNADNTQAAALNTEITNRTNAIAGVQAELNTTQAGAGLETDGTYLAATDSNYLNAAVTLKDADHKLDAAIKSVADRTTAIESVSVPALQAQITTEVNRAQTAEALLVPQTTTVNGHALNANITISQSDVGLGNVNNTADIDKPVSTAQANADASTLASAKSYADSLVVGLWDDRGNYDASVNTFPAAGGSGSSGAVLRGDIWTISVAGTLGGVAVVPRQTLRALIDAPGQTADNWAIGLANTDIDDSITLGVTGRAPSQNAVAIALANEVINRNAAIAATSTGVNTGDETADSIKTKLGITTLSGSNTGDQTLAELGGVPTTTTVNGHALSTNIVLTSSDVGLGNVNNTADIDKPVSTAQAAADANTLASAKTYADGLVVGLWDDRGNYDASTGLFPSSGGSGANGAVLKGDIWTVNVSGTINDVSVTARQTLRALIDAPGQTTDNWAVGLANTDIDDSITQGVTGRAPSQDAVYRIINAINPTTSISSLKDVYENNLTNGDVLIYNSNTNKWNNSTLINAGIQANLGFTPVANTITVNGHPLNANITISQSDVGLGNVNNTADIDKPVSTAQANADANTLANAKSYTDSETNRAQTVEASLVPQTTTVNGHALSANITITAGDVGLGNVLNVAQAAAGLITASGLNVSTNNVLVGRATAGAGPIEEITLGSNLSLSGNVLNAAGGITPDNIYNLNNTLAYAVTSTLTSCGLSIASGQKAIIRSIRVCNITSVADAITVQININGGANTPIANAVPVNANGSMELVLRPKVMSPGDTLLFKSQSASNGLQVIISYEINTDTTLVNAGYITTTTLGTAFTSNGTNATIVESCLLVNTTANNYGFSIAWVDANNTIQAYLVYGIVVPANSTIEIMQNAFRLPTGHKLQASCDGGSSAVYISGKNV